MMLRMRSTQLRISLLFASLAALSITAGTACDVAPGGPGVPPPAGTPRGDVVPPVIPPPDDDEDPVPVPGGDIDVTASALTTDRDRARADALSPIEVTVTLVGNDGAPVVGRAVTIVSSGIEAASLSFAQPLVTGADGTTKTSISSRAPGELFLQAQMPDAGATAALATVSVTFEPCLSIEDTLTSEVWGPVFSRCAGCHNEYGLPMTAEWSNRHILKFPGEPEFAEHNVDVLRVLAVEEGIDEIAEPGISYLVSMPTGRMGHSGGTVIEQGSPEEALLINFSNRLRQSDDVCGPSSTVPADAALSDVGVLTPRESLQRAKLAMAGAPLESADLDVSDEASLESAVDALLDDPRASDRVVEIYNDWLWTDRFTREVSRSTGGANLVLNRLQAQFPRRFYFNSQTGGGQSCDPATQVCCGEAGSPYQGTCTQPETSDNAANSLAREPLELVRHIWRNDLSADLIATADFTMANPYLATLYGFAPSDDEWTFDANNTAANDRNEFKPLQLRDTAANEIAPQPGVGNEYPHAGILTSHAVLLRYPATTSNRERRRASRIVYERFLGIDVMKLAEFSTSSLPEDADLDTATRTELACTACHSVMDPVARTLFSFNENSRYVPGFARSPREEMFEASFMGERFCKAADEFCSGAIQGANADQRDHVGDSVTWLTSRVVTSPRYPYAMVLPLFTGLTGATVLRPANDTEGDRFAEKNLAFAIQNAYLTELAQRFDTVHGRNLKALAKDILMGPFFRGGDYAGPADSVEARALALAGVGRGTLITPEQLSRKIFALTDERARQPNNQGAKDFLRDFDEYRLLFGGVNWESLTVRSREPNPVMMKVVERVANQVACRAVPEDFAKQTAANRRVLAPDLTVDDAVDEVRIRTEIASMRLRLLGDERATNDDEVTALYDLFVAARAAAEAGVNNLPPACTVVADDVHTALNADPDGTIRGLVAVTAAMLSDPLFIVE